MERHRPDARRVKRPPELLHERDQDARSDDPFRLSRHTRIRQQPRPAHRPAARGLARECSEGHEDGDPHSRRLGSLRTVTTQREKIAEARSQPCDPQPRSQPANPVLARDGADPLSLQHRRDDREHDLDPGDLPGKRIDGQHPLPTAALETERERDAKHGEVRKSVELPRHPALRQLKTRAAAPTATATHEQLPPGIGRGIGDDPFVPGRVHIEYVDHVLPTAPGSGKTRLGPSSFVPENAPEPEIPARPPRTQPAAGVFPR